MKAEPATPSRRRQAFAGRALRQCGQVVRTCVAAFCAVVAVTAGFLTIANWTLPIGILQKVGLADSNYPQGLYWAVTIPQDFESYCVHIWMQGQSLQFSFNHFHLSPEAGVRNFRVFGSRAWSAGSSSTGLMPRPDGFRRSSGVHIEHWGVSDSWVRFPVWALLVFGVYPGFLLWQGPIRRRRRRMRGLCLMCGYDLTGNVSGRCSECAAPLQIGSPS